jgi:hypothetical protein
MATLTRVEEQSVVSVSGSGLEEERDLVQRGHDRLPSALSEVVTNVLTTKERRLHRGFLCNILQLTHFLGSETF